MLNVLGLLCDIRPLHDKREWGPDLMMHHIKDLNVEIENKNRLEQVFIYVVL